MTTEQTWLFNIMLWSHCCININTFLKKDVCPVRHEISFLHKDLMIRCLVVVFLWETLSAAKTRCVSCFWFVWNKQKKKNCKQRSLCGWRDKEKEHQLQKAKLHQKKLQKSTHTVWLTGDLWKRRVAAASNKDGDRIKMRSCRLPLEMWF